MTYTQVPLDIHPNSFFKSVIIPQTSAFFEPYFCSQPMNCEFRYIFVISDKQSLISENFDSRRSLKRKVQNFHSLGIQIEKDLSCINTRIRHHLQNYTRMTKFDPLSRNSNNLKKIAEHELWDRTNQTLSSDHLNIYLCNI